MGRLCRVGDSPDKWWIVVEGTGDVTVDGRYPSSVGPGESIGELALLDGKPRSATVTATSDMLVWKVDGQGFIGALLESSRLASALLQELAQRLRRSNQPAGGADRSGATVRAKASSSLRRVLIRCSSTLWRQAISSIPTSSTQPYAVHAPSCSSRRAGAT